MGKGHQRTPADTNGHQRTLVATPGGTPVGSPGWATEFTRRVLIVGRIPMQFFEFIYGFLIIRYKNHIKIMIFVRIYQIRYIYISFLIYFISFEFLYDLTWFFHDHVVIIISGSL